MNTDTIVPDGTPVPGEVSSIKPIYPDDEGSDQASSSIPFGKIDGGGVTSARGFSAAGVHAGFRKNPDRLDLALVVADEPCSCAAMFTQNVFCSAPVIVSQEHLDGISYGCVRAVVVNSGNANAATGHRGLAAARRSAELVGDVVGCPPAEVMVASTGVIGEHLPIGPFEVGLPSAHDRLSREGGADAARAIMTTDTHPKEAAVMFPGDDIGYPGRSFVVGGMAKGSGMIMPDMATMIAVVTTDAPLLPDMLHKALTRSVAKSFNKITVDSDTSTNDSCYLLSSGAAASDAAPFAADTPAFEAFEAALDVVCEDLARQMAADGEGATRLITVRVTGAASDGDADAAARAVANSPLVKTAIYGHDANWGRIAMAVGKSGAHFRQEDASVDIMGIPVCRAGLTVPFDEDEALRRFERPEIAIDIDLGVGSHRTTVWTCDLSHDYISINGDYRS